MVEKADGDPAEYNGMNFVPIPEVKVETDHDDDNGIDQSFHCCFILFLPYLDFLTLLAGPLSSFIIQVPDLN